MIRRISNVKLKRKYRLSISCDNKTTATEMLQRNGLHGTV